MFEEVPRERRGMARLLPVRRVVLGPFVLGGGMLLAALGGSLAVAATVITASAISSDDLPDRPGHVVTPSVSQRASSSAESVSARKAPAALRPASPTSGRQSQIPPAAGIATSPGVAGGGPNPGVAGGPVLSSVARQPAAATATRASSPAASAPAVSPSPTPTPSISGPLGNAVIHVSGYDQASGRLAYQFATLKPRAAADGGDLYLISDRQTFTAALAPSVVVISGGSICPPAGSTCTPDQVIRAAGAGFFAQVAIDATGVLRSIIEVGDKPAGAAKLPPAPITSAAPDISRQARVSSSAPAPSATS